MSNQCMTCRINNGESTCSDKCKCFCHNMIKSPALTEPSKKPLGHTDNLSDREIALMLMANREAMKDQGGSGLLSDAMGIYLDNLLERITKYKL